jgi:Amt family ammonium transporter
LLDYMLTKRVTALSAASGAIAGLVCITPGCGYVDPMVSFLFGFSGSFFAWLVLLTTRVCGVRYDLDSFALHGVGGATGAALTGLFAQNKWNPSAPNGSFFGNRNQLGYQLAGTVTISAFAAVGTWAILTVLKGTIGIKMTEEQQEQGADESYHGSGLYANEVRGIQMQSL